MDIPKSVLLTVQYSGRCSYKFEKLLLNRCRENTFLYFRMWIVLHCPRLGGLSTHRNILGSLSFLTPLVAHTSPHRLMLAINNTKGKIVHQDWIKCKFLVFWAADSLLLFAVTGRDVLDLTSPACSWPAQIVLGRGKHRAVLPWWIPWTSCSWPSRRLSRLLTCSSWSIVSDEWTSPKFFP